MRYSEIIQGVSARQSCELPLAGARLDEATGLWTGNVARLDLRPLLPEELANVQSRATAYAKSKGLEAAEGVGAYEMALAIHTVHAAALVSGTEDDVPFFDVPPEALFTDRKASLDAFVYVYERQLLWQAEASPRPGFITGAELEAAIDRIGGGGDEATFFFVRLRPVARWTCTLSMARRLASARPRKSGSGFTSSPTTKATSNASSKRTERRR